MSHVEERRPTRCACVQDGEHRLEVAIQVRSRNRTPAKFYCIVPGVPPSMDNACGKRRSPSCGHNAPFASDQDSKRSRLHRPFLPLSEMHMRRWPIHARRQRAIERQYDPSLGVSLSAHPQNFSGMSVLQSQKIIHDASSTLKADNRWLPRSPTRELQRAATFNRRDDLDTIHEPRARHTVLPRFPHPHCSGTPALRMPSRMGSIWARYVGSSLVAVQRARTRETAKAGLSARPALTAECASSRRPSRANAAPNTKYGCG